jgi:RNA polymerase sigma-70 factor (ECF subfamily)
VNDAEVREFIERDYGRLVVALRFITGSRGLAEEAVQEALARAVERTRRGEHIESLAGWVAVVAKNVARSGRRRLLAERRARDRFRPSPANDPGGEGEAERLDLIAAVNGLGPRQREAIALYYFAGLAVDDVAGVMGLHHEAVKGLLHRARASLSKTLGLADLSEGAHS